jgi:O-antigen/teichoic acid export membrane protein
MRRPNTVLAREVTATIAIYFASYFLSYLANILISQLFGVQLYSDFAVGSALLTIASAFALLGFDKTTLQYLPRYFSNQKYELAAHYVRSSFWMILLFSLGVAITIASFVILFEYKQTESLHQIILLSLVAVPIVTLVDYLSKIMITKKRAISSLIAFKIQQPILLMIFVSSYYYFAQARSSALLIGCLALTWFFLLVFFLFWLRSDLPYYAKTKHPTVCWRAWLPRALPFWVCNMVLISVQNMGVLVLEILEAGPKDVAIFAAVSQTCHFLIMVHTAINLIALPRFSEIFIYANFSQIQSLLSEYLRVIFYFCVLFFIAVIIFGKSMLSFFGPEFVKGYPTLCVLTIGSVINVYCGLSTSLLQVGGLRRIVLRNAVLLLSITIVLMFILIPMSGILGAAWAFTIAMSVINGQQLIYLHRRFGISFFALFPKRQIHFWKQSITGESGSR